MAKKYMVWIIAIALCAIVAAALIYIRYNGTGELSDDCILVSKLGRVFEWQ
jgi:hypothetical protein